MGKRLVPALVATLVMLSVTTGVAAAADNDSDGPPEQIVPIDCPELTETVVGDSVEISDYVACQRASTTRDIQRSFWRDTRTVEDIANALIEKGDELQQSELPGASIASEQLEAVGQALRGQASRWQNQILSY
jgi:hypothetical protein